MRVPGKGPVIVTPEMRRAGIEAFKTWCRADAPVDMGVYDFIYTEMERTRIEQEQATRDGRLAARFAPLVCSGCNVCGYHRSATDCHETYCPKRGRTSA